MFKDIFNDLLVKNNISTYRLTKDTGIGNGLISNWSTGKKTPNHENLIKLSKYFNVSVDYLLGLTDEPATKTMSDDTQSEEYKFKLRSAARMQEVKITPEEDAQIAQYIDFLVSQRDNK